jgi:hypothetical protein
MIESPANPLPARDRYSATFAGSVLAPHTTIPMRAPLGG